MDFKKDFFYLDQLDDYVIDFSLYLKTLSENSGFKIDFRNIQPVKTTLKNLFYQTTVINNYKNSILNFNKYKVLDGETIDYVSYKFYNTPIFFWIIAVFNNIHNLLTDWVKTDEELQEEALLMEKVEGIYTYQGYYQLLFQQNEEKRYINILKPNFIYNLIFDLMESLNATTK